MCFVLFIVCLYICVCECILQNNNHKTRHKNNTISKQHSYVRDPLRECRSIWSGASGLPYYCAPLVYVSDVIDSLAVWRHNKPKTKTKTKLGVTRCVALFYVPILGNQCTVPGFHQGEPTGHAPMIQNRRRETSTCLLTPHWWVRTNIGPARTRSRQGLPLVVNGVSCWVRSKNKRRSPV